MVKETREDILSKSLVIVMADLGAGNEAGGGSKKISRLLARTSFAKDV